MASRLKCLWVVAQLLWLKKQLPDGLDKYRNTTHTSCKIFLEKFVTTSVTSLGTPGYVAAAQTVEAIVTHVKPWDPPYQEKQDPAGVNGSEEKRPSPFPPDPSVDYLAFDTFDITQVGMLQIVFWVPSWLVWLHFITVVDTFGILVLANSHRYSFMVPRCSVLLAMNLHSLTKTLCTRKCLPRYYCM